MQVSVVGSWKQEDISQWSLRGSFDDFCRACKSLGRQLAKTGQRVIVGSSSSYTADFHVVTGVLEIIGSDRPRHSLITVIRPDRDDSTVHDDLSRRHHGVFTFKPGGEIRWAESHLIAVRDCGSLLTIGGGHSTYQCALAAVVARKKLVPIASFGGASLKIFEAAEALYQRSKDDLECLSHMRSSWSDIVMHKALNMLSISRKPKIFIIHGRSKDWLELKDQLVNQVGLENVEVMGEEFGRGLTLPEKFERMASRVDAAIAIATPDDRGGLASEKASIYQNRARQNVWLEVGWFWGRLGRDKVMIL
jgi:hypothetical protein